MPDAPIVIYIDGGSRGNPGPAGFGVRVEDGNGTLVTEFNEAIGVATNNVAEYRGLLAALEWAHANGHRRVRVRSDSELLVKQMRGEYRVKHPGLQPLHAEARVRASRFDAVRFEHVPREENAHADLLANEAMDAASGRDRSLSSNARARSSPTPAAEAPDNDATNDFRTPRFTQLAQSLAARQSNELARALERLNSEAPEAIQGQDARAMAAWFAPDAVLLVPGLDAIRGRAAIEAFYAASFGPPANLRDAAFTTSEVEIVGDVAIETGTSMLTTHAEGAPNALTVSGKYLAVWSRQPDGAWLLWRAMGSG